MSVTIDRDLLMQVVVVVGSCLGGWVLLVEPRVEKLHAIEAQIIEDRSKVSAGSHVGVIRIAEYAPKLHARADKVDAKGQPARDSAGLYGMMMSLAQRNNLKVRNIQPRVERGKADEPVSRTQVDVIVEGTFERLASFLSALDGVGAYIRMQSLRITPTDVGGEHAAVMQLGCEVLSFRLPDEVTAIRGSAK